MKVNTRIPLFQLQTQHASVHGELLEAAKRVIESGVYILGPEARAFEEEFAKAQGVRYCVGLSSGTEALKIALEAVGVRSGSEVIVPAFSFIATATAVAELGARPIFADVDANSLTLDPGDFARRVTPRTKAVVPVHLYGNPAEMKPLLAIAREAKLNVVEDCAQAHLARYGELPVGGMGDIGAFSFYPSKNLGALGDAGCVVTQDRGLMELCRTLSDVGRAPGQERYRHTLIGYNARLDEIQAAFLRVKLKRLSAWNEERRLLAETYRSELQGLPLNLPPKENPGTVHSYHLFVVRTPKRDALAEYLKRAGIGTGIYYPLPLHLQPAFQHLSPVPKLPQAERAAQEVLALPIYPGLAQEDVARICSEIRGFFLG